MLLSLCELTFEPVTSLFKRIHQTVDEILAKRDQTEKGEKYYAQQKENFA